ncbi:hypothetical protein IJF91_02935 [Candidatus Saccharibacteria bacterium]|nr:hypothetical protein [Candidatus Saccharibacteria bacterium]
MIHLFYGEDRLSAEKQAKKVLGEHYENIDAENLKIEDLPTLFLGTSLFDETRKVLIKGLSEQKSLFEELEKYLETPHEIVVLENKINGNWTSLKSLKKSPEVDLKEFKLPEAKDRFLSFNIYSTALSNPEKAVKMLRENQETEDPYLMLGAWTTQALKALKSSPNSRKNREILKELAKIDMLLKSTKFSENPWPILETFLLRLKTF